MIHINILSKSNQPFFPHWNKEADPPSIYDIKENSEEDIVWDCVVIYQDIPISKKFRCRKGNVFYFSGEPPMMVPMPSVFTKQFDKVVLPHPKVKHKNKITSHGFLNWSLGYGHFSHKHRYDFNDLKSLEPEKKKLISIVTSNQKMMPGHNKRMAIIERLQRDYPDAVDIFGRGFKTIDFKADALLPYYFHICIENSSIKDYWTEKIADPILAQCVPIYAGCKNISSYFGRGGYLEFNVDNYDGLCRIIDQIIKDPVGEYNKFKSSLAKLRIKLMEEQNLIPFVIKMIDKKNEDVCNYCIKPLEYSWQYRVQFLAIRFKRFVYRIYFKLVKINLYK